jgi:hypothetical protein
MMFRIKKIMSLWQPSCVCVRLVTTDQLLSRGGTYVPTVSANGMIATFLHSERTIGMLDVLLYVLAPVLLHRGPT